MPRFVRLLVLIAALQLAGCYTFREITPTAVAPGRNVRVTLTDEEMVRQQEALGRPVQVLEAEVVRSDAGGSLDVTVAQTDRSPSDRVALNTFLSLPWSSVVRIEEKRFNAGRTAIVAGVGAIAAAGFLTLATGGSGDQEPPGTNENVIAVLRFIIR